MSKLAVQCVHALHHSIMQSPLLLVHVVVIDDGVETGTAAAAAAEVLRDAGARRLTLAVPVCPRDAEVGLLDRYDDVVAVVRPLVRRSLRWHYETLP